MIRKNLGIVKEKGNFTRGGKILSKRYDILKRGATLKFERDIMKRKLV